MRKAEQIRRWQLGMGLPLFTVGMALAANLIVHRLFSIYTLLFFIFAVSITATVGRPITGVAAAALSVLSVLFFLVEPLYTWSIAVPQDGYRLGAFALCSLLAVLGAWLGRLGRRERPPLVQER